MHQQVRAQFSHPDAAEIAFKTLDWFVKHGSSEFLLNKLERFNLVVDVRSSLSRLAAPVRPHVTTEETQAVGLEITQLTAVLVRFCHFFRRSGGCRLVCRLLWSQFRRCFDYVMTFTFDRRLDDDFDAVLAL